MKSNELEARRAGEILDLTYHQSSDLSGEQAWNDEDIEDDDRQSKGSDCCGADVRTLKDDSQFCSACSAKCVELFEDDDEYLARVEEENRIREDKGEFLELAYSHLNEGGY